MHQHSDASIDRTFLQLRSVVRSLGRGGGLMTPSIYETAQVLRFCPELVETNKVIAWLLNSQQLDGGWGDVGGPLYRVVPTAAAILALNTYSSYDRIKRVCAAGYRFLEEQQALISPDDGAYLPVAIELILPRLLDEMGEAGMPLSRARYQHIEELGLRRRKLISEHTYTRSSPPVFSWEAWGTYPDPDLVGFVGGVGHSPAATAWWLLLNKGGTSACKERDQARQYIADASCAAANGIHGIVPAPWPMGRFEQCFVLQAIEMSGLLTSPQLADELVPQLADLQQSLVGTGLGFSDHFAPDGDNTAAAVSVLTAAGIDVDLGVLGSFERPRHFVAYPFEMHMSFTVTARAAQAIGATGRDVTAWCNSVAEVQQADGWWPSEKWNRSRLYGTAVALRALERGSDCNKVAALEGYLQYQREDGGWGCFGCSTPVESALAVLAIQRLGSELGAEAQCLPMAQSAHRYLRQASSASVIRSHPMWISKDLFSATRIDHATILCALLAMSVPARTITRVPVYG